MEEPNLPLQTISFKLHGGCSQPEGLPPQKKNSGKGRTVNIIDAGKIA